MANLEEKCWSDKVCQDCGSKLRDAVRVLRHENIEKRYCSQFCYERGMRLARLSAPVFVAPAAMNIRDNLLASL